MKFETEVKEIIFRTYNVVSVRFPRPAGLEYKPGQYFFVSLRSGGKELKHHFSFSSSPTEIDHIEFTKKLSDSDYSAALKALKIGDWAGLDAPYGKFTFEGEHEKIGLLGGGIGITPFISIVKYCTDKRLNTKITLLYGNRSENDIAFRKELEEMQRNNENFKLVLLLNAAVPGWTGPTGFIDADLVKKEISDYSDTLFFTCGPPPMVEAMKKVTAGLNLPKDQLKAEIFMGYA